MKICMRFFFLYNYMNTLLVLYETFTNGYSALILNFIYLAAILTGILVIISKNPVVSVLFLIGLFLSISSYLFVLRINFIGLAYLLVYVGAVSILFIFILMLINVRKSELYYNTSRSIPLAIIIGVFFIIILIKHLPDSIDLFNLFSNNNILLDNNILDNYQDSSFGLINFMKNILNISNDTAYPTTDLWEGNMADISDIASIGSVAYGAVSIWLVITSLILLLAMVGAIVITIKQKETIVAKPSDSDS